MMADILNRLFNRLNTYPEDVEYDEGFEQDTFEEAEFTEPEEGPRSRIFGRPATKVVDLKPHTSQQQVVIMQPADIEAAQLACDHIRAGKTVICNIEKIDPKIAQRVIDFVTGAAYALDGKLMPVSSVIFVVAPRNTALVEGSVVGQSMEYLRQTAAAH
jgi:cell division inhibitor SepF